MLEVEDILPSPLTPLILPESVYEMQTPALSTKAQSSPQPQSVDTANYAWVNPLPSPTTTSSSSGELHLYIDSDSSPPSTAVRPSSSSQEMLLQGNIRVPLFSTAHKAVPTSQPQPQSTRISSWADEVATAEHSDRSTPETVISKWAHCVGFVDHDQDRSHWWYTLHQWCQHPHTASTCTLTTVRPDHTAS